MERSSERGPLHGVPVAVKDVIDVAGARTTAASRILADNVAAADADGRRPPATRQARSSSASSTRTSSRSAPPPRARTSARRVTRGTPSGSAAARAAAAERRPRRAWSAGTLGTDTAGSIRIPAAFCGVTGLRPSTGRVSNRGVVPVSWTFDTVGPIARTAEDCALLLEAIAGADPDDPACVGTAAPAYGEALGAGVRGLRIGLVSHLLDGAEPAVAALRRGGAAGACGARRSRRAGRGVVPARDRGRSRSS